MVARVVALTIPIDASGWLHTGDLGILDEAGYLQVTGRIKDVFIVGGFNCYPAEIEKVLFGHDAIAQVAISAAPDDRLGDVGIAHVVLAPNDELTADELIGWARERMANYKVPRHVLFTASLPLDAAGKVLRHELPSVA
jgi:acyl-CoA synthetase (AMP-forming)/AMP-acid ligase II